MANIIPRWYYRYNDFLRTCALLQNKLVSLKISEDLSINEKQHIFNLIKNCYVRYWHACRDFLKSIGIIQYFPKEALNIAEEKGFINDGLITKEGIEALEPYRVKRAIFIAAGSLSRLSLKIGVSISMGYPCAVSDLIASMVLASIPTRPRSQS